jgi:hypothetical protein
MRPRPCGPYKEHRFSGHPIALTGETFDKQIERNDMPVIVDFC